MVFQNKKAIREVNYESSENFEIRVLVEVPVDKVIMVPEKSTDTKQSCKTIYKFIGDNYFEQYVVKFTKYFLLTCNKSHRY